MVPDLAGSKCASPPPVLLLSASQTGQTSFLIYLRFLFRRPKEQCFFEQHDSLQNHATIDLSNLALGYATIGP